MSGYSTSLEDASQATVPAHLTDDLVPIEELASMLGVSVRTVRRYQAAGLTPRRIRRCRQLMYRRSDIQNWIENIGRSGP